VRPPPCECSRILPPAVPVQLASQRPSIAQQRFLLEGFELSPSYVARLQATLGQTEVRGCFLGHSGFSVEGLAGYRGPKPQHRGASRVELGDAAAWIRRRSRQLREESGAAGMPYVDVGELGFEAAMREARRLLLGRG
jgi:hypothetical protein